ncbi:MAG: trigger factor [Lachnospiraceae bacterium]|nr:trigger factor [Lachnospiraceae bacterium]
MSVQVENLEKNMAKLTIEVPAEEVEKALQAAYQKQKGSISVPGFRKGKVPRAYIEKVYGAGIFYEEAANNMINTNYGKAVEESGLDVVSQPTIDVVQIEKGKSFIFTAEVAVKPEVTLGQYKGIEVLKANLEVSEEEIAAELKKEQEKNSRTIAVEGRAAQLGDIVTIDFEGKIDDIAFPGGAGNEYPLTLGSGSFIPGFEEQLVGVNAGETKDVNVTFPEDYNAEELKGKAAVFTCTVHKIEEKELPELNDDFAQDVSEFDTLDEYKADIQKTLAERKAEAAKTQKENAVIEQAVKNAEMEIPEAMVLTQASQQLDNFARRLQSQGMTMEQYKEYTGQGVEELLDFMKPQAQQQIEVRLVLEAIAKAENLVETEAVAAAVDAEIAKMAENYKMDIETIKGMFSEENMAAMKLDMACQEAVNVLVENAVEVDSLPEA